MTNSYNIHPREFAAIEALTGEQLKAIRLNLQLDTTCPSGREDRDEETREAVAEYLADGGSISDLLGLCADCDEAWEVQFDGLNLCHRHADERATALENAQ